MQKSKIVVVGPGLIGKQHAKLAKEHPYSVLSAIVAPDHEKNHNFASKHGVPIFFDLEDCIRKISPDGVIVSSPNKFHFSQASICIRHGIPALVEKPITISVEEGEALAMLSEQCKVPVLVGHHRAHSPILEKAREVIQSGRLGKLVTITGSAQFYKPESYFRDGIWRTEPGGGPILINLIHEISNLRSMCGEIRAVHAFASSKTRGFVVEDTVSINIMFSNGVIGNFILSDAAACAKSWEHTSGENPAYPLSQDEDCYFIAGTKGSLSVPTFRLKYYSDNETSSWWVPMHNELIKFQREDPLARQLDHFLKVIKGDALPLVSARDGLNNLKVTEAVSQSAKTGQVIWL